MRKIWNTIKIFKLFVIGVLEWELRKNGLESIMEKRIIKSILNVIKYIK